VTPDHRSACAVLILSQGTFHETMARLAACLLALWTIGAATTVTAAEESPGSGHAHLALGAFLGTDRLETIAWPESGEIIRLQVRPLDQGKTSGKHFGYDVLGRESLSGVLLRKISQLVLKPGTYVSMAIRRPVRPDGYGRGSGRLCGEFHPAIGVRFVDAERRAQDILICFSCDEIEFMPAKANPKARARHGLRVYLSDEGSRELLRLTTAVFTGDDVLKQLLQKRTGDTPGPIGP
jgi:hypothetical protein